MDLRLNVGIFDAAFDPPASDAGRPLGDGVLCAASPSTGPLRERSTMITWCASARMLSVRCGDLSPRASKFIALRGWTSAWDERAER